MADSSANGLVAVAIVDHHPKGPAELELKVGDVIKVTKRMPTRWIGTLNGKVGSFPPECVEVKDDPMPAPHSSGKVSGRGRGRGSGIFNTVGRHSSYIPESNQVQSTPAGDLMTGQAQRPKSNYTPAPEPEAGSSPSKFSAHQLPPPPASLVERRGGLHKSTGNIKGAISHAAKLPPPSVQLPKFSEVTVEQDGAAIPPPRSPPVTPRLENLPPLPPRDGVVIPSDAPPQEAPKKRSKEDLRQACLQEIYQTEKDYIADLENIISVFIMPLRLLQIVPEPTLYNIFSNIEVLVGCNKEFFKEVEEQMGGDKTGVDIRIGGVFKKLADYFKMYKVYSANQQNSLTTVDTLLKKNPDFKKKLDICHSDPRCRGLFLQSFLIKPIQRVCKYPLLLRELIAHTPEEHQDYNDLKEAFAKINEVVANINEYQRQAEGLQRILDLQKLVDGIDTLVAPGRYLQKEADLNFWKSSKSKHPEKRHVFFFSDMIMLTTRKGDRKFDFKLSFPFDNCSLTVLDSSIINHSFELNLSNKKGSGSKCVLSCETGEEAAQWIKEIKTLMKDYQKRKMNELRQQKKMSENFTVSLG